MSDPLAGTVALVLRACGERTTEACASALAELFPGAPLARVGGADFHAALAATFDAGLAAGRPWTLCIDADVLPAPGLRELVARALRLGPQVFAVQGLVEDKLMRCARPAGNHLYRTRLLEVALPLLDQPPDLRPETRLIQGMAAKGYGLRQTRILVGLHDYEQYLTDIYAKAWLHGHKHGELATLLRPAWQALAGTDPDFRVALAAFDSAHAATAEPSLARRDTAAAAAAALAALGVSERGPLAPGAIPVPPVPPANAHSRALAEWFERAVFPARPGLRAWSRKLLAPARLAVRLGRTLAPLVGIRRA